MKGKNYSYNPYSRYGSYLEDKILILHTKLLIQINICWVIPFRMWEKV